MEILRVDAMRRTRIREAEPATTALAPAARQGGRALPLLTAVFPADFSGFLFPVVSTAAAMVVSIVVSGALPGAAHADDGSDRRRNRSIYRCESDAGRASFRYDALRAEGVECKPFGVVRWEQPAPMPRAPQPTPLGSEEPAAIFTPSSADAPPSPAAAARQSRPVTATLKARHRDPLRAGD